MYKKPELLAPAGGIKALKAAVQSGADAVYLGADRFSARAGADNFTLDTLEEWIDYCHLRGVSVHLAANTLIKQREAQDFISYVCCAYQMGIDALIIQDIGMAMKIKDLCPDLCLHASTQMTVSTPEGVRFLENVGFKRVVLARELTADEIRKIQKETKAELEVFVHGALCFCYSGQCLMSSIIGQRSGNRGHCAQPCRLPYELIKDSKPQKQGFLLSPKDLCLAPRLKELCDMGIDSFKLEGRLKSAEYVATVTGVYRKIIDGASFSNEDNEALLGAFNRSGFTEGWYSGAKSFMSGTSPSNIANNKAGAEYVKYTAENADFRKIPVSIFAQLKAGEPLTITMLSQNGDSVTASGTIPSEVAERTPLSIERLTAQLEKLGTSTFIAENTEVSIDEGITLPISEINAVRRLAVEKLSEVIVSSYKREYKKSDSIDVGHRQSKIPYISAVCYTLEQAITAAECVVERIIAPESVINKLRDVNCRLVTLFDGIGAGEKTAADGIMVMNAAQTEHNQDKKIYGGFRLNVYNSLSEDFYKDFASITLSPELNLKEMREISTATPCEVIAYGRLPLMLMRACPAKINGLCRGSGGYELKDRRGERFPILCGRGCTSQLLNSKPIYMADKMKDLISTGIDGIQLWFTTESANETKRIIENYKKGIAGETPPADKEFTRGHFYRGVV